MCGLKKMAFKLTPRKERMVQEFFERHLPGQQFTGIRKTPYEKYLGIPAREATGYAQAVFSNIFNEDPNILESQFEREMKTRIAALHELVTRTRRTYGTRYPNLSTKAATHAASYLTSLSAVPTLAQTTFTEKLHSSRLFFRFLPFWLNQPTHNIGGYGVHFKHWSHVETPLSLEITNPQGISIATVGLYVTHTKGGAVIRINNLQGKNEKERIDLQGLPTTKAKRIRAAEYSRLAKALGEDWRTFYVRKIIETVQRRGFQVEGEMPHRFYASDRRGQLQPTVSEPEYQRQKKVYTTAFQNAGMKEVKGVKIWRHEA